MEEYRRGGDIYIKGWGVRVDGVDTVHTARYTQVACCLGWNHVE
jgi:hypothetical protein